MNNYEIASAVVASPLYIPLAVNVVRRKIDLNFATWLLWAILDGIAAGSSFKSGGTYVLPAAYTVGSTLVAVLILIFGKSRWTDFETLICILAVVSMIVWHETTADAAIVASTLALAVAAMPTIRDAYRQPQTQPLFSWIGFLGANALGVLAGDDWSVKERFYATSSLIVCSIITALSARKLFKQPPIIIVMPREFPEDSK